MDMNEVYEIHVKQTRAKEYAEYLARREAALNSRCGKSSRPVVREMTDQDRAMSGREWYSGRPSLRSYELGPWEHPSGYEPQSAVKVEWYPTDSYAKQVDRVLNRTSNRTAR